ncbi:hypothetical protein OHB01_08400 [Microbispora hainanensis]|uniref:Uncharacterized protein n=1 Tax=Microbispora hainanensis TaxID=568844 RepID=A0ABZ1T6J4_9ACTN|nr:hypothetical protein [Microbispora hainanensis]
MPESFRLKLVPGADPQAVLSAAIDLPGVSNAVDEGCLRDDPDDSRRCDVFDE